MFYDATLTDAVCEVFVIVHLHSVEVPTLFLDPANQVKLNNVSMVLVFYQ
jgi:hypothetical protein